MKEYIQIKDKKIELLIRNYRTAKTIKLFFKGEILNVTKPTRCSYKMVLDLIKENEEKLDQQYGKQTLNKNTYVKHWKTGEQISYRGELFTIIREEENKTKKIKIFLKEEHKKIWITVPVEAHESEIKKAVDKGIIKILKKNMEMILQEKLPYWSKITNIQYHTFKVRDAISKYGSCIPKTKALMFSSRLIMLPDNIIDAIIVHELCHITYKNHSKDFYQLVKEYIPNYDDIRKWLKRNNHIIII